MNWLSTFALIASLWVGTPHVAVWEETIDVEGLSKQEICGMAEAFANGLPQYGHLLPQKPVSDTALGLVWAERGFLLIESKGLCSYPVAEISYKVETLNSAHKLSCKFYDVKIYPFAKNKLGRYERSTQIPLTMEDATRGAWKKRLPQIKEHLQGYAQRLKDMVPIQQRLSLRE